MRAIRNPGMFRECIDRAGFIEPEIITTGKPLDHETKSLDDVG